ncbi:hypothetical protein ABN16_13085 [Levilactobacillus koreensis]|uniref:XRE family transcriptional regulator n=1 Tax=Levilactobacillus koreensis TaxID=637971 RepID=A0AAC9ERP2_9LACO|nr:hypothetical protein ABN16_13085 [Levilactobacillus koreensis]
MQRVELAREIQELLGRKELTDYAIGKGAGVDIESVRKLRKGKSSVGRLQLDTVQKLLDYKVRLDECTK